jgi:glycosyltransferase involved in cell wall biosynthesis
LTNHSPMPGSPLFTVFTATYNRAHTLHRVFDSLCAQTIRDFEWLIIDDGSSDDTSELISRWAAAADFPIRYFRQDHSGKHIAHNLAIREARGQFFLSLDSDDACAPRAMEMITTYWNAIPLPERTSFFAVVGLCRDQHGEIIGDIFPSNPFDSNLREKRYVHGLRGEKWGAALTEVVRRYPFPAIAKTHFAPEGIVWLDIAKTYKTRYVNEVFRIYYVDDYATGTTLTKKKALNENAPGRLHYNIWLLNNDLEYFFYSPMPFLKAAVVLPVAAYASKQSLWSVLQALNGVPAKVLVLTALPIWAALYFTSLFDRIACHSTVHNERSR